MNIHSIHLNIPFRHTRRSILEISFHISLFCYILHVDLMLIITFKISQKFYKNKFDQQDWIVPKLRKKSKVDKLLAVDCEMVLCDDGTEALVKICVVDQDLKVLRY